MTQTDHLVDSSARLGLPRVVVDQLTGPGGDRGLGRYAREIARAAGSLGTPAIASLTGPAKDDGFDAFRIQQRLDRLRSPRSVYHSTSVYHLPALKREHWICSVQDTIQIDLKEYSRLGLKSRLLFRRSLRSEILLANSRFTASRLQSLYDVPSSQLEICSLPVSDNFRVPDVKQRTTAPADKPFVVALVDDRTPDPRKRFHWVAQIIPRLAAEGIDTVIAGRGLDAERYPGATIVTSPSDQELASLYSDAVAMFYPSAYEGQGMPPLEAMTAGCPVVAFDSSAVAEMVGVGAFLLPDPAPWAEQDLSGPMPDDSVEAVIALMLGWADAGARESGRAMALEASAAHSWENFLSRLGEVYERALRL